MSSDNDNVDQLINSDKVFYDSKEYGSLSKDYANTVLKYARQWSKIIIPKMHNVRVLDLGAGSCLTGMYLSQFEQVNSVICCDISSTRMQELSKFSQAIIQNSVASKLEFLSIDFNEKLPFEDNSFDLVFTDAALHHSRNIWATISDIKRVLVNDGKFVAQREQYVSPITHSLTLDRLLKSPEVAAGVSENAYLKSQYEYYLKFHGFSTESYAVFDKIWMKALFFLNGIVFSKYNIVGTNHKPSKA